MDHDDYDLIFFQLSLSSLRNVATASEGACMTYSTIETNTANRKVTLLRLERFGARVKISCLNVARCRSRRI